MNLRTHAEQAAHWFAATITASLTTILLVSLRASSTTAGMVFLVLVVWWATRVGTVLSIYTAALCAVSFDYFFLPPVHTLSLVGAQAWVAMLCFVVSCVVVSRLAERARRQAAQAEQRQADVSRLYALSQEMMLFEDPDRLLRDLPGLIKRIFERDNVVLYIGDKDSFYSSEKNVPLSVRGHLQAITEGLSPTVTPLTDYQSMALMVGMRALGALAWQPETLSHEVAAAVSAQVSIAVARSMAIEASSRMEAARESERLRTALIDSLTHELRTPLTSIRAAATTLLEGEGLDEAGRLDMAAIIDEEAERLDLLIGESVEMAEIDANVVRVKLSPQHPRAFMEHAVEESRKALAAHKVSIATEGEDPTAEDEPAWFDAHLLGRVLRHLLENVASHTPAGSRVTLRSHRVEGRLEFLVEDNGPGIDAADLPLIFEKFYRGKGGIKRRKGSGMGLAITRAILTAHGGGIEGSNIAGGGARFQLWVPLIDREPSRAQ